MQQFSHAIPLSLYVHLPWCVQKCPYCDFNSHTLQKTLPESAYIDQLLRDLEQALPELWGRPVQSIFIGGGTPSLFSPASMARLLTEIRSLLAVVPQAEITLEANPGTTDAERFAGFFEAGINRLSIGVQSLDDSKLKALGRIHSSACAILAIAQARAAGFDNINVDLMFALPQQKSEQALSDLAALIALKPHHLSWYQLTLEPNTAFYADPPALPTEDMASDMQQQGQALLAQAGFEHYEISAYSTRDLKCRHNINYWLYGDYLGLGAGAHSKITHFSKQCIERTMRYRHPRQYLVSGSASQAEYQVVNSQAARFEFMLNAMRLRQKIPFSLFEARTGLAKTCLQAPLKKATELGFITQKKDGFQMTDFGLRFYNDAVALFL